MDAKNGIYLSIIFALGLHPLTHGGGSIRALHSTTTVLIISICF